MLFDRATYASSFFMKIVYIADQNDSRMKKLLIIEEILILIKKCYKIIFLLVSKENYNLSGGNRLTICICTIISSK